MRDHPATMDTDHEKIVLRIFRPIYRIFFIYDLENFHHADLSTILRNAGRAIIFSLFLVNLCICWYCELAECIKHSFRLNEMGMQLALNINLTAVTVIYVAFGMRRQLVGEAMDRLQATVIKSMSHLCNA